MKKTWWPVIILLSNLVLISLVVIAFLIRAYPMVGHDYGLAIPILLDTDLHFRLNGLMIQWYTPSFGGGLPVFPDPNNIQFSLLSFFTLLVQPLQAVMISTAIYIIAGGLASYLLLKRVLKLHWTASILGAVFFSANGFMLQRVAVGHLGYIIFPLIAILLLALLDTSLHWSFAGILMALVFAMMLHQAGYFIPVVFGLTLLISLPLIYIYRPGSIVWKRLVFGALLAGGLSLVMSASKLAAVFAFMRFFPRQIADSYPTTGILQGLFGIGLQLAGTMTLAPLLNLIGSTPALLPNYLISVTGAHYGFWEFDMSLSPIVIGILVVGIYSFLRKPRQHTGLFTSQKRWIAWILLAFFTWLTVEFILAKGVIYPYLRDLPILGSLHVNPRFTSAMIFPLGMLAAIIYNRWVSGWSNRKAIVVFFIVNVLTLVPLSNYFMIQYDLQARTYDMTESEKIYSSIHAGDTFTITGIADNTDNTQALYYHLSNLDPYDPIFGYNLENFHPEIKVGSIWETSDGYYNMTNPTGYVFPELNGTRPFERIPVSQKDELEAFASHKQPDWKIPLYQQILDWVSGLTVLVGSLILVFIGMKRLASFLRHLENAPLKAS